MGKVLQFRPKPVEMPVDEIIETLKSMFNEAQIDSIRAELESEEVGDDVQLTEPISLKGEDL